LRSRAVNRKETTSGRMSLCPMESWGNHGDESQRLKSDEQEGNTVPSNHFSLRLAEREPIMRKRRGGICQQCSLSNDFDKDTLAIAGIQKAAVIPPSSYPTGGITTPHRRGHAGRQACSTSSCHSPGRTFPSRSYPTKRRSAIFSQNNSDETQRSMRNNNNNKGRPQTDWFVKTRDRVKHSDRKQRPPPQPGPAQSEPRPRSSVDFDPKRPNWASLFRPDEIRPNQKRPQQRAAAGQVCLVRSLERLTPTRVGECLQGANQKLRSGNRTNRKRETENRASRSARKHGRRIQSPACSLSCETETIMRTRKSSQTGHNRQTDRQRQRHGAAVAPVDAVFSRNDSARTRGKRESRGEGKEKMLTKNFR
jgi:hypothetical protein